MNGPNITGSRTKGWGIMRIRTRLLVLLFLVCCILVAATFSYRSLEMRRLYALFQGQRESQSAYFNNILRLKGASLKAVGFDYSFWDEMVTFVRQKNMAWAEANLSEEVFKTYQTDGLWVFRTDLSLVYSIKSKAAEAADEFPLQARAIGELFSKGSLRHFFINTKAGLMEFYAATIVPSTDPERQTPAQGYFFAARLWDENYVHELEDMTGGALRISVDKPPDVDYEVLLKNKEIMFVKELVGFEGKPAAYIIFTKKIEELKLWANFARQFYIVIVVFIIAIVLSMAVFLTIFVSEPFTVISKALKEGKAHFLKSLRKDPSEFGDISRLIEMFFHQKEELEKEIKERKKAQERFQQVSEAAGEWIWEMDRDGLYVYSSSAVQKILGYTPEEVVLKKYFYDFFPEKDRDEKARRAFEFIISGKMFKNFINPNIHRNGNVVWLETTGFPIFDKHGHVVGYRGIDLDVTERKKAEEGLKEAYIKLKEMQDQLIQAEKLNGVGQLASSVAHEVRNPLAIIMQGVEYMKASCDQDHEMSAVLDMLKENIKRADKIVNDLLDFSRAAKLDLQPLDIGSVLESSLNLVRTMLKFEHVQVVKEIKSGLPQVLGDKNRLEQVFINILMNSGQAMPQGGSITIRAYDKRLEDIGSGVGRRSQDHFQFGEQACVIEIEDTGTGITEEDLKKIFDPFFTTKGTKGAGLGLSVSRNIIHMHRGLIYAKSKPGEGTKITVILKVSKK